jgi:DhnA family fructose-bisphosphate aldolase class Ia
MAGAGERIRLSRLFNGAENAVIVAVDHGLYFGPLDGLIDLPTVIIKLKQADGVLLSAGMATHCADFFAHRGAPAMILRLNWATNYMAPWQYEHSHSVHLLNTIDAMRLGADIVLGSVTLKTPDQAEDAHNVELFAKYVQQKELAGVPIICEVYPIGGDHAKPEDLQEQVAIGCRMAAELGADMIKTFYTGHGFAKIALATPIPILALGALKKPSEKDALLAAAEAIEHGARGIVFGRNVVQASNPERLLEGLKEVVKNGKAPDVVATKFQLN